MKIVQSYQQGAKHISRNQPCEDRTFYLSGNDVEVIALADGAGSQKYTHSAVGAECVTEAICNFFCNNFDKFYNKDDICELQSVIMTVCQKKLQAKAEELKLDSIMRLSSTLLVIAIKIDKVIICHIGDGVIGKLTESGTEVISAPENGEFASTTYFITNSQANTHINILKETVDDALSYFLMSDGTSEYVYDEDNRKFFDATRKMALLPYGKNGQRKLEQIIKDYMIEKDSLSDDCSFICISTRDSIEENMLEEYSNVIQKENDFTSENEGIPSQTHTNNSTDDDLDNFSKSNVSNGNENKADIKKILIIVISIVVIILAMLVAFLPNSKKANKKSKTNSTSTSLSNTTSRTSDKTKIAKSSIDVPIFVDSIK